MGASFSQSARTEAALAILDIDVFWAGVFSDISLHDLNYYDLFTKMWLKRELALTKTELYEFMPEISRRTAVKYVQRAIDLGMIMEHESSADRRVRLVGLTPDCRERVERFLDFTCKRFNAR
ncbi:MarR family transcriptional regulator [Thalassolituus sp.]|jgi:DNA-binding MarR family transcriptional regulator|uniref:MarR family transcriptional regulator n=1 Tax=Thalassolituus sp. TaxID=2030822 RepID=UPI002A824255|nr:MarR family transcriptional regulator [Thalassolituus sp.]|tara:strand:- start:327 stop:692 length:366 start_codon:yes stop_codon:yes gene_type:complete